jgi:hypothetical protein
MKQIILGTIAMCFAMSAAQAQNFKQSENHSTTISQTEKKQGEPMAVVTFSQKPQPSQLIVKVKALCQGDDRLTEMVIAEIYKRKDLQIKDVIADVDFKLLSRDEQNECVSESEVNELINQLKR